MISVWRTTLLKGLPLVTLLCSASVLLWLCGLHGWYPHDEGLLGQSALRVLKGEIPHRDFTDPYSGGLALFHSLIFRVAGVRLDAIRRAFDLVTFAWLVGFYLLARRIVAPWTAVLASLGALLWGVLLYPAAMPSWYLLFFVTAALALLAGEGATEKSDRIVAAGTLLGLGVLVKITALYAIAGVCLGYLGILRVHNPARRASVEGIVGAGSFVLISVLLTQSAPALRLLVHVTIPATALCCALLWGELRAARLWGWGFDGELRRFVGLLAIGVLIPVVPFLLWLQSHTALTPFFTSIRGVAAERSTFAAMRPPTALSALLALPLLFALLGRSARFMRLRFLVLLLALVWAGAWEYAEVHRAVWQAVRGILPVGAIGIAWLWSVRRADERMRRPSHLLVALVGSALALGQFPFAAEIYFAYLVPLMLLALLACLPTDVPARRHSLATALTLLSFSLLQVLPGTPIARGFRRIPPPHLAQLPGPFGGLLVPSEDAELYSRVLGAVERAGNSTLIWVGPDAPEVAFLAGRIDLNRAAFSFLDPDRLGAPPDGAALERAGVRTVVIQLRPAFSEPLSSAVLADLGRRFPASRVIGTFDVRWRE